MKNLKHIFLWMFGTLMITSCEDFLDVKPDLALVVPESVEELRALLDNGNIMNETPSLSLLATDDIYFAEQGFRALNAMEQAVYTWAENPLADVDIIPCWSTPYQQIFYSNLVLDRMDELGLVDEGLRGAALFYRSYAFFNLVSMFSPVYSAQADQASLGIPLVTSSNVNQRFSRSSVNEAYHKILGDLEMALELLPRTEVFPSRPTTSGAEALLARVFLAMGDYEAALSYAEKAWTTNPYIMDFAEIDLDRPNPFMIFGEEVIYHSRASSYFFLSSLQGQVSPELFNLFGENDYRRRAFLQDRGNGFYIFSGNYTGTNRLFTGITSAEVLLILVECKARLGNISEAAGQLALLMENRYEAGSYVDPLDLGTEDLLESIMIERRKELAFRGQRFMDLKRLNRHENLEKALTREVEEAMYNLPPNDGRYAFPLPQRETEMNPEL
ncbi:RagB/SusD family nutrient uptake outer membrane protein [Litoribacter ruber]|uniref:RagB/SusD family nutrient uptake outer membrane protein n=1 Tax=Litoribacter ruber TaxID=702568 RepID=UPI001BDB4CB5|nr:RagB/SusD family nutrient uptake outer membrane protein [Litoribacter ruber]MBT0812989.1 RagB/SusD family nutrient uptake outer membrane protein [Litoribacter ruber]